MLSTSRLMQKMVLLQKTCNPVQFCSKRYYWDNIAPQIKTLRSVVREAPNNIAPEKNLCNLVLIPLGQHCTVKKSMRYCPEGSRQQCIEKILVKVVLILLGELCTGQNPMQCCPRGSRQHCTKKILCNVTSPNSPNVLIVL